MDEDLWLEDGLEELFLGEPAMFVAPPVEITGGGGEHRRARWDRPQRWRGPRSRGWDRGKEEDTSLDMMLEAANKVLDQRAAAEAAREANLAVLKQARIKQELNRYFTRDTSNQMTREDRKLLAEREIARKANADVRRRQEAEAYNRQLAMNIKMARVRAAKKK